MPLHQQAKMVNLLAQAPDPRSKERLGHCYTVEARKTMSVTRGFSEATLSTSIANIVKVNGKLQEPEEKKKETKGSDPSGMKGLST